jgi:hypothetical protein
VDSRGIRGDTQGRAYEVTREAHRYPQPEGKWHYKAKPKCDMVYLWESEGRKVLIEVRDNRTLAEGSLPALVMISKQGKTS